MKSGNSMLGILHLAWPTLLPRWRGWHPQNPRVGHFSRKQNSGHTLRTTVLGAETRNPLRAFAQGVLSARCPLPRHFSDALAQHLRVFATLFFGFPKELISANQGTERSCVEKKVLGFLVVKRSL